MFSKKASDKEAILPRGAALLVKHTKRAVYQGSFSHGKMFDTTMNMPCPEDWADGCDHPDGNLCGLHY